MPDQRVLSVPEARFVLQAVGAALALAEAAAARRSPVRSDRELAEMVQLLLRDHPAMTTAHIGNALGIRPRAVAPAVDRLLAAGAITRVRGRGYALAEAQAVAA